MPKFYKKKNQKNRNIYLWIYLFVAIILLGVLFKNVYSAFLCERKSSANREESEMIYQDLVDREDSLVEDIQYLKTDKGIESELRNKFRLVKEGEEMVVILDSSEEEDSYSKQKQKSFFAKIVSFFRD